MSKNLLNTLSIRNIAATCGKSVVKLPFVTNECLEFIILVQKSGFIQNWSIKHTCVEVELTFIKVSYLPVITNVNIISLPSRLIIVCNMELWFLHKLPGRLVLHTNKGLKTCVEAQQQGVGGILLAYVR